jgi:hypothetical protein
MTSHRTQCICRHRAISVAFVGIGSWGAIAKWADTFTLMFCSAIVHAFFSGRDFDLSPSEAIWLDLNRGASG